MRARSRWVIPAVVAVALAGCGRVITPDPADILFARTGAGVALIRTTPQVDVLRLDDAVPTTDWSAVVRAVARGKETRIEALDTATGDTLWQRELPGRLEVKIASDHGRLVALGDPRQGTGYRGSRGSTTLVIAGAEPMESRIIELEGNYEPEAFSTDGTSLFVVEYLPARDPTRYRVRRLDLLTEEVVGVYTVDQELQEAMRGTARVQAASPDGRRLYTLYSLREGGGTSRTFVHVLSLDELWAHCVDLPADFDARNEQTVGLSVSPDGGRLYVADSSTDSVAEVDTAALAVTRTTKMAFGSRRGPAHVAGGSEGMLYLASGTRLVALDAATLEVDRAWDLPDRITGIQVATDGERVYVGLKDEIAVIDSLTGDMLEALDPDAFGTIDQLGRSTRSLDEERTEITCAC